MNVSVEELMIIIGELTLENRLLKSEIDRLNNEKEEVEKNEKK